MTSGFGTSARPTLDAVATTSVASVPASSPMVVSDCPVLGSNGEFGNVALTDAETLRTLRGLIDDEMDSILPLAPGAIADDVCVLSVAFRRWPFAR